MRPAFEMFRRRGVPALSWKSLAVVALACSTTALAAMTNPVAKATAAATFSHTEIARVDRLLRLMQPRLEIAPAIAEMRWKTRSRIEDEGSERAMLESVRRQSSALSLDVDFAVRFAQAQIDAGKIIQSERHKHWAAEPARSPQ